MSQTATVKAKLAAEPAIEAGPNEPSQEAIRQRAYEIYCSRNGAPGTELEDWLQAERELRSTT